MKKLFLLSSLLFLFLFVPLDVSAVEFSNIPKYEGHPYFFTYYDSVNNKYATVLSSEKIYVDSSLSLRGGLKRRYFSSDGKNWSHYDSASLGTPYNFSKAGVKFTPHLANHDIMYNGSVFFSPPVSYLLTVAEMGGSSLGNLMMVFGETLAELLPAGLMISGGLLAIYLTKRLVVL